MTKKGCRVSRVSFRIMGYRIVISCHQQIFALTLGRAGSLLAMAGFGLSSVFLLLGILPLSLRFTTLRLARYIARISFGIRWKFEVAIAIIAMVSLFTGLISMGAMTSMHNELHNIRELGESRPAEVLQAANDREDTQQASFSP